MLALILCYLFVYCAYLLGGIYLSYDRSNKLSLRYYFLLFSLCLAVGIAFANYHFAVREPIYWSSLILGVEYALICAGAGLWSPSAYRKIQRLVKKISTA